MNAYFKKNRIPRGKRARGGWLPGYTPNDYDAVVTNDTPCENRRRVRRNMKIRLSAEAALAAVRGEK